MKRVWILLLAVIVCVPLLTAAALRTAERQEEPSYLIISTYQMAPGRTFTEASEEVGAWVRAIRRQDGIRSARLYFHGWGSEVGFHVLIEPASWAAIPAVQAGLFEAFPDLVDRPWNWSSHTDNILSEIPVD